MKQGTRKLVMKPNFKDGRKFSENLMGVEMEKSKIKMTGACVPCSSHTGI